MKNKKGFTLIELIVVVSLLALLGVTIGISLNKVLKDQKDNEYITYLDKIKSGANLYITNNSELLNSLYTNKGYIIINLKDLVSEGYLNANMINPLTEETIDINSESENNKIKASLNNNGILKIEYPIISENSYFQALNLFIKYGTKTSNICYNGLNTYQLGFIDTNGNILSITEEQIHAYVETSNGLKDCNNNNFNLNQMGNYKIIYEYEIDGAKKRAERNVIIGDNDTPTCNMTLINGWLETSRDITFGCSDDTSLCTTISYDNQSVSNQNNNNPFNITKTFDKSISSINYTITDKAGNKNTCTQDVKIDMDYPTAKISKSGLNLIGEGKDEHSGIAKYQFSKEKTLTASSSGWQTVTASSNKSISKTLTPQTSGYYYFYVIDNVGHLTRSDGIYVNTNSKAPICELNINSAAASINANASDDGTIIASGFSYDYNGETSQAILPYAALYTYYIIDDEENVASCSINVDVVKPKYDCVREYNCQTTSETPCNASAGRCSCGGSAYNYWCLDYYAYRCCCRNYWDYDNGSVCLKTTCSYEYIYDVAACPAGYGQTNSVGHCNNGYTMTTINGQKYCYKIK